MKFTFNIKCLFLINLLLVCVFSFGQTVRVTDNKGTILNVKNNRVTTATTAPTTPTPIDGDVWFNNTNPSQIITNIYNGTSWISGEHKGTTGSVFFAAANGLPTENNSQLFWDSANNRFGVGTNSPTNKLEVSGAIGAQGILNSNGTVGEPAFRFKDDTNTGIYRPAADELGFSVGGIEALKLDEPTTGNTVVVVNQTLELQGKLLDTSNSAGTAGQILSSTATGTSWINNAAANNWLLTGNSATTASNFLGTTDDVKMQIRSNNISMLEFGRRQTLGLTDSYPDYTDNDQALVYLKGNGATSALQFAATGASFYKPMFFTTTNGSFRLKGSAGATDLFEIGSAGPANEGRLEFIVGDDGAEPMIFKRYNYYDTTYRELFRVQGSTNASDAKTRFGINLNPVGVAVDAAYNNSDTGSIANSTFQVNGSVSNSIFTTTANLNLTEDHHTIVLGGNHTITLPTASTCTGRRYVIKNTNAVATTISSYLNNSGTAVTTISRNSTLSLQSDGSNWQQFTSETQTITQSTGASATGDVTLSNGGGTVKVVSTDTNNQIKAGTDGGAYLGPTVYTGSFIITAANSAFTISGIPFTPSQVTFVAYTNVGSFNLDTDNGVGNNNSGIANSFGGMNGFANNSTGTIVQNVIYVGGSGNSINDISRFSSNVHCIGLRFSNQNGDSFGKTTARLSSFTSSGFVLNVDSYIRNVIVLYTAYK